MTPDPRAREHEHATSDSRIVAILFADVIGYSRLISDAEVFQFYSAFLGSVAELLRESPEAPLVRNTWGDGLYLVFGSVRDAGVFALRLCQLVSGTAWSEKMLPDDLNVRVAVHAGPLLSFRDPVTEQWTFSGKHATRAARIEPVTPPGVVYASREFAALATAQGVREFHCYPAGRVRLAKGAGTAPLFVVRATV